MIGPSLCSLGTRRSTEATFTFYDRALGFVVGAQVAEWFGSWRWALRVSPPRESTKVTLADHILLPEQIASILSAFFHCPFIVGLAMALLLFFFTSDPPRGAADGHRDHGG